MGNLLKEALKNLCGANQWSYAIFWKISCQNPKLLIWEECFYELISQSSLQGISRIVDPGIGFEGYNARGFSTRSQAGDNLHFLMNKTMADNHVNIVGEGYNNSSLNHLNGVQSSVLDMNRQYKSVGRAALTGNHQWILSKDYNREAQPPEVLQELYRQFSAGIQTVAVIPVLHHGVVQLGSFFSMAENVQFVNDVKTSVLQLHQDPSILLSGNHAAKALPLQIGTPVRLGNSTSEGLSGIPNLINSTPFIPESCNYVETSNMSSGMFTSGELRPDFVLAKRKHEFEPQSSSFTNTEYEDAYMETQSGDDLFGILGIDFKNKLYNGDWSDNSNNVSDSNRGNADDNNLPSVQSQVNASEIHSVGHGSDYLLDAVVFDVHSSAKQLSGESVSRMKTLKNPGSNYGTNAELPHSQVQVVDQIKEELGGISEYLVKTEAMSSCFFLSGSSIDYPGTYSPSSSIYGLQISSSISKGYDIKPSSSASTACSKNPDEKSKTNRKKPKPGESPRPRPKDRQMIQDRVTELREIVPNGAKCSIDSLLERTIKHMLFLQSVTKHADKLKLIGEPKIISKDGSVLSKDKFEGGATWAYEVGSQSMICPIIVEDLNEPRQMLVEILCETRGLFLEIADIIRGLGLTILKGVMETWNDKIWAHFAVEANRDVTRMEVFVSLTHLLEQNVESGIQPAKDICMDIP